MRYQGKIENIFSITGRGNVIASDIKYENDLFENLRAVTQITIIENEKKLSTLKVKSTEILTKKGLKDFISFFIEDGAVVDQSLIGKQFIIET